MSFLIPCPHCGNRSVYEFRFGGEVKARPQPEAPAAEWLEYTYTNSPFSNRDQKFLLKGNTYFYRQSEPMLQALATEAGRGRIARMVYQPRLPMFFG